LRRPDEFTAPARVGADGAHLSAVLYRLAHGSSSGRDLNDNEGAYAKIANRLAQLIEDVSAVRVDRDEKRELFTIMVTDRDGTEFPARALSDGTLRFLALAILEIESDANGLICLEEPENGIHPDRIPAMIDLLQSIAVDVRHPVGSDNPLRQVIINTHSPSVVASVSEESLLMAVPKRTRHRGKACTSVDFEPLEGTWRANAPTVTPVSKGHLLAYLSPHAPLPRVIPSKRAKRVKDRADLQPYLMGHD
jgi:predicted ATPase